MSSGRVDGAFNTKPLASESLGHRISGDDGVAEMRSRIPSWAVAVVGAGLVVVATAIGSIWYVKVSTNRVNLASEALSIRAKADGLWASHLQGDQRGRAASVFIALALSEGKPRDARASKFAYDRAAVHLRGAFTAMWAAADMDSADTPPLNVADAESKLKQGDPTAYNELSAAMDGLRIQSARRINELRAQAAAADARAEILADRQTLIYTMQVVCNLLGLILVMCKDLPVWARHSHRE